MTYSSLVCPICGTSLGMPADNPPLDGDIFVCPGCIGVVGIVAGDCVALLERDLIELTMNEPDVAANLEARRIELAQLFAREQRAPTIFGAVAAQMYLTHGPDCLRIVRGGNA